MLDLLKVKNPVADNIDGKSFASLVRGDKSEGHVTEHYFHWPHSHVMGPHSMVLDGDMKLIEFQGMEKFELYNLAKDPNETQNLSANPELKTQIKLMTQKLHRWLKAKNAQIATTASGIPLLLNPDDVQNFRDYDQVVHEGEWSILGGSMDAKGDAISFRGRRLGHALATKKMESAIVDKGSITFDMDILMKDGIRNGYLVFGQVGQKKELIKCGVKLSKKGGQYLIKTGRTVVKPSDKNQRSFKLSVDIDFGSRTMVMTEMTSGKKLNTEIPSYLKQIDTIGYMLDDATMTRFSNLKVVVQ
jgi:hypothetical protein